MESRAVVRVVTLTAAGVLLVAGLVVGAVDPATAPLIGRAMVVCAGVALVALAVDRVRRASDRGRTD